MKFKDFNFYNKSIDKDLKEFYTLMEYAFPDENERDTFEKICHYLIKNKQQNNQYHVLIAYDNEKILGGSIFTYLNNSSSGVVEFIVVSPNNRQKGVGKAIYEEMLNILKLNTKQNKKTLLYVFAEIDKPQYRDENDRAYLYFWTSNGFKVLDIDYLQPALEESKQSTSKLLIIIKPMTDKAMATKHIQDIFVDFFSVCFDMENVLSSNEYNLIKNSLHEPMVLTAIPLC